MSIPCAVPSADRTTPPVNHSRPSRSASRFLPFLRVLFLAFACLLFHSEPVAAAARTEEENFARRLILGAREEVGRRPLYRSAYYAGGYPPASEGVCTDLVWRAFTYAGYDLKKAMDADIRKNRKAYPRAAKPDPNIDFRRVPNQTAFFRRHAETLTTKIDPPNLASWQPGDIVVFTGPDHIAILSDKRNADGFPLLLHNQGPFATEGDAFMIWYRLGIVAHFRFVP